MPTHEQIGHTVENRPLVVHHCGSPSAKTRVLLIAGQHGDEPLAREATQQFVELYHGDAVHIAALINANPDGAHGNQRHNAAGVDLNRDHQQLAAPETAAIHAFARAWRPHLIVDVHTYPPRRKHLLARGWVHANDVFIDIANNPTARAFTLWATWLKNSLPIWIGQVRADDMRCDRYTIVTKNGRVRHSTPDVVDARNGLALACNVPTVLLEGREPTRYDDADAARRTVAGLVKALGIIVAALARDELHRIVETPLPDVALPIRSRYEQCARPRQLEMVDQRHEPLGVVRLPGPYLFRLKVTRRVVPPQTYGVSKSNTSLLALLSRHGVDYQASDDDLVEVAVTKSNARLLAVLLEPRSKYSPHRQRSRLTTPSSAASSVAE